MMGGGSVTFVKPFYMFCLVPLHFITDIILVPVDHYTLKL